MRVDEDKPYIVILDGEEPDMAEEELVEALRLARVHIETFWARYNAL